MLKVLVTIAGVVILLLIYVEFTYKQKFDAPVTGIQASSDSAVIARGKYLVLGPSHCYACHTNDSLRSLKLKEPLMGGAVYKTPFGDFNFPNITMDRETGIGNRTDEELARSIRYNINHRREAMPGFMSYHSFSDDDLTAIVSYLRTTVPVRHNVADHDLNILGKIITRFLIKPKLDVEVNTLKPDTTAAYGKYIAFTVGQCNSCHTRRDKMGQFVGEPFAGGFTWDLEDATFVSPNLTPHATGRITHWSEDTFVKRFRRGRVFEGSPMPWEGYQNTTEQDLKALYRFLMQLPPENNDVGQTYIRKDTLHN